VKRSFIDLNASVYVTTVQIIGSTNIGIWKFDLSSLDLLYRFKCGGSSRKKPEWFPTLFIREGAMQVNTMA